MILLAFRLRNRPAVLTGIVIFSLILTGSGCLPVPSRGLKKETEEPTPRAIDPASHTAELDADAPTTPTPALVKADFIPNPPAIMLANEPTPVADPLRFSFPTLAPPAVSAWRPPLYPTPWVPTPFDHFYFSRPIAADEVNWPLADYRYGGVFFPNVVHTGIDIPAPPGTPVLAAGSGRVHFAGYGLYRGVEDPNDPYGLAVVIKHDFGYQDETLFTVYGHMSQIDVVDGQQVQAGDQIGLVGQTGKVTGPHLHFEVRLGRNNFFRSRNPELWLAPPQGWGILAARLMSTSGQPLEDQLVTVRAKDGSRRWSVKSYSRGTVVSDFSYQENMVLGDLPAGIYEVWIAYAGILHKYDVEIKPGMVTYFRFRGRNGFTTELPAAPVAVFIPPVEILTTAP
ncbi:MAG TPA: M23 family metallopeptidase [Anaerolineales bacterium]|nr:M23 family metallopeptidase [Anaerolineales bacterium]